MTNAEGVSVETSPEVIHIRLTRPPVNAFTPGMFDGVAAALSKLAEDRRPVLLSGDSGVFSAGFDIKSPQSDLEAADAAARTCVASVRDHPGPTVAAVEGAAVGVGLLLAMSVDVLVVARDARLRMPEITLGVDADVNPLRRFLAEPWVRRLCLLGEAFTPEELCLYAGGSIVCDPGTALDRGIDVTRSLGRLDPVSVRKMKRQFLR